MSIPNQVPCQSHTTNANFTSLVKEVHVLSANMSKLLINDVESSRRCSEQLFVRSELRLRASAHQLLHSYEQSWNY